MRNVGKIGKPIMYFIEGAGGYTDNNVALGFDAQSETRLDKNRSPHVVIPCTHAQLLHADRSRENNQLKFIPWFSTDGGRTIVRWRLTEKDKRAIRRRQLARGLKTGDGRPATMPSKRPGRRIFGPTPADALCQ